MIKNEYDLELVDMDSVRDVDCLIVAVAHESFKQIDGDELKKLFGDNTDKKVLIDVKGIYSPKMLNDMGVNLWRL